MTTIKPLLINAPDNAALKALIEDYEFIGYTAPWMVVDRVKNTLTILTRPKVGAKA